MLPRETQTEAAGPSAGGLTLSENEPPMAPGLLAPTGIEALDSRLGGLVRGRHYLLDGAPGAGKSSAALQFLGIGIALGERCLVLTQDDPSDLISQAEYLGYDFRKAAELEDLVVIRFRLDFARNYQRAADPARVFTELKQYIDEHRPARLVIDSMSPFLEGGRASDEALAGFPEFLEGLDCTTWLVVPGDLGDTVYNRIYDRVIAGAAGIFHFEVGEGQVRQLSIRKLRQPVKSTAALRFVIRPGAGIVEYEAIQQKEELPPELRRRIIVLNSNSALSEEVRGALEQTHELVSFDSTEHAFGELVAGRYGALIVGINPRETERVFNLTRELRRAGNGAPILFVSLSRGLRGSTRARGLRAGGDDFLTDALSPEEFLERIEVARERGHRRSLLAAELEPLVLQPVDEEGNLVLLTEEGFRAILREKLATPSHAFFAIVTFHGLQLEVRGAWDALCASLRIQEGDLGALTGPGEITVFLHDVRRKHVDSLLRRISASHPGLGAPDSMEVFCYPADRHEVESWLRTGRAERSPAV
jgi:KaiC/GvpD/RAD55 family RecA-like ATPase/DNA-binding response OmpR family regulator